MGTAQAGAGAARRSRAKPNWKKLFLAELALTSNVAASARKAGKDASSAYKERRADSAFARAWFDAQCEGYDNLEMDLLQRLREGQLEGGAAKKGTRKYDNATAFRLLAAHRASVNRTRARREDEDEDAIYAAIHAKLDAMRERAQGLPRQIEQAPGIALPARDAQ